MTSFHENSRSVLLVLGMHRSGTSAMTGLLQYLKVQLGRNLLTGSTDNPSGYWEVKPINQFNSRLLVSAGTAWNDPHPIAEDWFSHPARGQHRQEALALLAQEFGPSWRISGDGPLLLKDPRITRLLPFWLPLLRDEGLQVNAIMMVRSPLEVAMSLRARCLDASLRPWGIASISVSLLLWLRYQLDCILGCNQTRLNPSVVNYQSLRADPVQLLCELCNNSSFPLEIPSSEVRPLIASFVRPELYRQRFDRFLDESPAGLSGVNSFFRRICAVDFLSDLGPHIADFQDLAFTLDRLCAVYRAPSVDLHLAETDASWSEMIFEGLSNHKFS